MTLIQFTDILQWKSGKKMQSGWNLKVTIWKKTWPLLEMGITLKFNETNRL